MQTSSIALILPIADSHKNRRTGAKATNLAKIVAARFAVPRGFVISADAYRSHLWASGTRTYASAQPTAEQREAIRAAILNQPISEDVWQPVVDAYERLSWRTGIPDPKVAVRSSAIEDGSGYAGAYESYLNVSGTDALNEAIRRAWASLWSGKASAYRTKFGSATEPAMAIIVQQMVDADFSGTSYTADPVTGDPRSVAILVRSGEKSARCAVDLRDFSVSKTMESGELCIDDARIRLIAERSILIEDALGGRAAIEWAVDRDGIWILQADPIAELPDYFNVQWQSESDRLAVWVKQSPHVLSQFARSLVENYPDKVGASQKIANGYIYACEEQSDALAISDIGKYASLLNKYEKQIGPSIRERLSEILDTDWASADWQSCAKAMKSAASAQRESYAWMRLSKSMQSQSFDLLLDVVNDATLVRRLLGGVDSADFKRDSLIEDMAQRFATAKKANLLDNSDWQAQYRHDVQCFIREYGFMFADESQAIDPAGWRSWIEDIEVMFGTIGKHSRCDVESTLVTQHCAAKNDAAEAESKLINSQCQKDKVRLHAVLELARGWICAAAQAEIDCALASAALRVIVMELARRLQSAGAISSVEDVFNIRIEELAAMQSKLDASCRSELAAKIARRKHEAWLAGRIVAPDRLANGN